MATAQIDLAHDIARAGGMTPWRVVAHDLMNGCRSRCATDRMHCAAGRSPAD
jgi:hypothetical protein